MPEYLLRTKLNPIWSARRWCVYLSKIIANGMCVLTVSACISTTSVKHWPDSIPERKLFVDAFNAQRMENPESHPNSLNNHLMWVQRFYLGSAIYPIGWNKMTNALLETIAVPEHRESLRRRMHILGIKICNEWAQDNSVRKIDSAAVAIWGNGLSTAAEANEQLQFVSKVEKDVDALLGGTLNMQEISSERYYPTEDYDNF